jgi:hypothetical protein
MGKECMVLLGGLIRFRSRPLIFYRVEAWDFYFDFTVFFCGPFYAG